MKIMAISEENIEDFTPLIGEDLSSDLERVFFRGIGAKNDNDEAVGVLVYELLGAESDAVKSIIRLQKGESREIEDDLQRFYKEDAVSWDSIIESFYEAEDEEDADICEAAGFSKAKGESPLLRVTLADILNTVFAKRRGVPKYIRSINELSLMEYRTAIKNFLFKGQKGLLEDLAYLPMSWFDVDVSVCSTNDKGVDGMFLVRTSPTGVIMPVLYYAYGPYYVKNLAYMLIKSIEKAAEKYPPDTPVVIYRTKKASRDMAAKIIPKAKAGEVFFGSRKEQISV